MEEQDTGGINGSKVEYKARIFSGKSYGKVNGIIVRYKMCLIFSIVKI